MKWFEHSVSCRDNKKWRRLSWSLGGGEAFFTAYGRVWRLWEIIAANEEENRGSFHLEDELDLLAEDLAFNTEAELVDFLNLLASFDLINAENWHDQRKVAVPKLAERADNYTTRRLGGRDHIKGRKEKDSESVRTPSEHCSNSDMPHYTTLQDTTQGTGETGGDTKENNLTKKKGEGGGSPDGDASSSASKNQEGDKSIVYRGTFFDLTKAAYDFLRAKGKLLSDEQFHAYLERLELYAADRGERYARFASGKLKNPTRILGNWLEKEIIRPSTSQPKPPNKVDSIYLKAKPDCKACNGTGMAMGNRPGSRRVCECIKQHLGGATNGSMA